MQTPPPPIDVSSSNEEKARYLRALYRAYEPSRRWTPQDKLIIDQTEQAEQVRKVKAEYVRLFGRLDQHHLWVMISSVWVEARELAGQRYDYAMQAWVGPDGERIRYRGDNGV